ncbi:hypothetical protein BLNAU_4455 [Blattamonas nauphoetae]|uniref:Uncharacterized protein n=1 Tax=Blattamonas nauphoetae TaxID=2049346 RepID=A0ABQ9Y9V5_9EUKA|nr:hypothetical protein BLNAU_4455 [Blattamonas nauphoetae]
MDDFLPNTSQFLAKVATHETNLSHIADVANKYDYGRIESTRSKKLIDLYSELLHSQATNHNPTINPQSNAVCRRLFTTSANISPLLSDVPFTNELITLLYKFFKYYLSALTTVSHPRPSRHVPKIQVRLSNYPLDVLISSLTNTVLPDPQTHSIAFRSKWKDLIGCLSSTRSLLTHSDTTTFTSDLFAPQDRFYSQHIQHLTIWREQTSVLFEQTRGFITSMRLFEDYLNSKTIPTDLFTHFRRLSPDITTLMIQSHSFIHEGSELSLNLEILRQFLMDPSVSTTTIELITQQLGEISTIQKNLFEFIHILEVFTDDSILQSISTEFHAQRLESLLELASLETRSHLNGIISSRNLDFSSQQLDQLETTFSQSLLLSQSFSESELNQPLFVPEEVVQIRDEEMRDIEEEENIIPIILILQQAQANKKEWEDVFNTLSDEWNQTHLSLQTLYSDLCRTPFVLNEDPDSDLFSLTPVFGQIRTTLDNFETFLGSSLSSLKDSRLSFQEIVNTLIKMTDQLESSTLKPSPHLSDQEDFSSFLVYTDQIQTRLDVFHSSQTSVSIPKVRDAFNAHQGILQSIGEAVIFPLAEIIHSFCSSVQQTAIEASKFLLQAPSTKTVSFGQFCLNQIWVYQTVYPICVTLLDYISTLHKTLTKDAESDPSQFLDFLQKNLDDIALLIFPRKVSSLESFSLQQTGSALDSTLDSQVADTAHINLVDMAYELFTAQQDGLTDNMIVTQAALTVIQPFFESLSKVVRLPQDQYNPETHLLTTTMLSSSTKQMIQRFSSFILSLIDRQDQFTTPDDLKGLQQLQILADLDPARSISIQLVIDEETKEDIDIDICSVDSLFLCIREYHNTAFTLINRACQERSVMQNIQVDSVAHNSLTGTKTTSHEEKKQHIRHLAETFTNRQVGREMETVALLELEQGVIHQSSLLTQQCSHNHSSTGPNAKSCFCSVIRNVGAVIPFSSLFTKICSSLVENERTLLEDILTDDPPEISRTFNTKPIEDRLTHVQNDLKRIPSTDTIPVPLIGKFIQLTKKYWGEVVEAFTLLVDDETPSDDPAVSALRSTSIVLLCSIWHINDSLHIRQESLKFSETNRSFKNLQDENSLLATIPLSSNQLAGIDTGGPSSMNLSLNLLSFCDEWTDRLSAPFLSKTLTDWNMELLECEESMSKLSPNEFPIHILIDNLREIQDGHADETAPDLLSSEFVDLVTQSWRQFEAKRDSFTVQINERSQRYDEITERCQKYESIFDLTASLVNSFMESTVELADDVDSYRELLAHPEDTDAKSNIDSIISFVALQIQLFIQTRESFFTSINKLANLSLFTTSDIKLFFEIAADTRTDQSEEEDLTFNNQSPLPSTIFPFNTKELGTLNESFHQSTSSFFELMLSLVRITVNAFDSIVESQFEDLFVDFVKSLLNESRQFINAISSTSRITFLSIPNATANLTTISNSFKRSLTPLSLAKSVFSQRGSHLTPLTGNLTFSGPIRKLHQASENKRIIQHVTAVNEHLKTIYQIGSMINTQDQSTGSAIDLPISISNRISPEIHNYSLFLQTISSNQTQIQSHFQILKDSILDSVAKTCNLLTTVTQAIEESSDILLDKTERDFRLHIIASEKEDLLESLSNCVEAEKTFFDVEPSATFSDRQIILYSNDFKQIAEIASTFTSSSVLTPIVENTDQSDFPTPPLSTLSLLAPSDTLTTFLEMNDGYILNQTDLTLAVKEISKTFKQLKQELRNAEEYGISDSSNELNVDSLQHAINTSQRLIDSIQQLLHRAIKLSADYALEFRITSDPSNSEDHIHFEHSSTLQALVVEISMFLVETKRTLQLDEVQLMINKVILKLASFLYSFLLFTKTEIGMQNLQQNQKLSFSVAFPFLLDFDQLAIFLDFFLALAPHYVDRISATTPDITSDIPSIWLEIHRTLKERRDEIAEKALHIDMPEHFESDLTTAPLLEWLQSCLKAIMKPEPPSNTIFQSGEDETDTSDDNHEVLLVPSEFPTTLSDWLPKLVAFKSICQKPVSEIINPTSTLAVICEIVIEAVYTLDIVQSFRHTQPSPALRQVPKIGQLHRPLHTSIEPILLDFLVCLGKEIDFELDVVERELFSIEDQLMDDVDDILRTGLFPSSIQEYEQAHRKATQAVDQLEFSVGQLMGPTLLSSLVEHHRLFGTLLSQHYSLLDTQHDDTLVRKPLSPLFRSDFISDRVDALSTGYLNLRERLQASSQSKNLHLMASNDDLSRLGAIQQELVTVTTFTEALNSFYESPFKDSLDEMIIQQHLNVDDSVPTIPVLFHQQLRQLQIVQNSMKMYTHHLIVLSQTHLLKSQPEVSQPEVSQPEVSQPEVSQPEVSQPEVAILLDFCNVGSTLECLVKTYLDALSSQLVWIPVVSLIGSTLTILLSQQPQIGALADFLNSLPDMPPVSRCVCQSPILESSFCDDSILEIAEDEANEYLQNLLTLFVTRLLSKEFFLREQLLNECWRMQQQLPSERIKTVITKLRSEIEDSFSSEGIPEYQKGSTFWSPQLTDSLKQVIKMIIRKSKETPT